MFDLKSLAEFSNINMNYAFDPMTKAYVKGLALEYADYLIRNKQPFSLFFIDVDNFKSINDTVGHQKGDEIMEDVAGTIMDCIGDKGIVGRYGGDEYIAILEGLTEYDDVWSLAESMAKTSKKIQVKTPNDNGIHQIVTLTMGITRYPSDGASVHTLVERADKALYRGKAKGRNCFIIFNKALHGNLIIGEDASLDVYKVMDFVYEELGCPKKDQPAAFRKVLCFLFHYLHLGGIYTFMEGEFSEVISNGEIKNAAPVPEELYNHAGLSETSRFVMNFRYPFMNSHKELVKHFTEQNIRSEVLIKIETKKKDYGYVRFDIGHEHVWSKDEILILETAVRLLGFVLAMNEE